MTAPIAFGPYRFALTDEEARVAIARLSLRYGLSRHFERDYVAPLVLFVLLLVFIAILAFTGLIGRRAAEAALLLGAILFLATRFLGHWRLRRAQRLAKGVVDEIAAAGETTLTVDGRGFVFRDRQNLPRIFRDVNEIENAGGLLYLWFSECGSAPLVIPTRIFANEAEADRFLVSVRGQIGAHVP